VTPVKVPPLFCSLFFGKYAPLPLQSCLSYMSTPEFIAACQDRVLLDVRSPGEFAHGHIPGAVSFPLFSDEERAHVGTFYKQQGKEAAFELGLKYVGPKMATFVRQAKVLAPERRLALHCWRGGQRSGSMAWLLRMAGFDVVMLTGGYKAFRAQVLADFEHIPLDLLVIGGKTGTGKTKILRALAQQGEQIIDLERLACHKGSAFGTIGESPQPTVEHFENLLWAALQTLNLKRRVWIENESHSIGRVFIPPAFWAKMKAAPLLNIAIPDAARIQNLLADYVLTDKADLITAFGKIQKKLGGLQYKLALEALQNDAFEAAATIALYYYDKTYLHCLDHNISPDIRRLSFEHGDAASIASQLCQLVI
jgi:tRNA 2-selenouridine synthase